MVVLGLMKILVQQICIYIDFEGSCQNYMDLNEFTPGAVFDVFFEDRKWTILSENTNKYVYAKLRQAKDNGDKDAIELLSEDVDQNPCA